MVNGKYDGRLAAVIEGVLNHQMRAEGARQKIFLLTLEAVRSGDRGYDGADLDQTLTLAPGAGEQQMIFSGRTHIRELDEPDATAKALTERLEPPLPCYEQVPERPQEEPNPWQQILFSTDVFLVRQTRDEFRPLSDFDNAAWPTLIF